MSEQERKRKNGRATVTLVGPVLKKRQSEKGCFFSIPEGSPKEPTWFSVFCPNDQFAGVNAYVDQGAVISVTGTCKYSVYKDKPQVTLFADSVYICKYGKSKEQEDPEFNPDDVPW